MINDSNIDILDIEMNWLISEINTQHADVLRNCKSGFTKYIKI